MRVDGRYALTPVSETATLLTPVSDSDASYALDCTLFTARTLAWRDLLHEHLCCSNETQEARLTLLMHHCYLHASQLLEPHASHHACLYHNMLRGMNGT